MVVSESFLLSLSSCFPLDLLVVIVGLACVNAALAAIAFTQLFRIHVRNRQVGWTRQKVLHLMIGSSTLGYVLYLMSTLIATCEGWLCWSNVCGFILMACPKILFLAAFLLLLSFWVDLCHQANDDDDDDDDDEERSAQVPLLHNSKHKPSSSEKDIHRKCCSFQGLHVGSRQKFVIVVVVFIFVLMTSFAVMIWIGAGKNPINSAVVARVYVDLFALTILLLGGALGCYGFLLCLKLSKVRSERSSSEMWKVAGLAVVSILCFTSSALIALLTDIPLFYHWHLKKVIGSKEPVLLILYYFIGSSVPSAFVLCVMRELPPATKTTSQREARSITFVSSGAVETHHPQRWTIATTSNNRASRASPI